MFLERVVVDTDYPVSNAALRQLSRSMPYGVRSLIPTPSDHVAIRTKRPLDGLIHPLPTDERPHLIMLLETFYGAVRRAWYHVT